MAVKKKKKNRKLLTVIGVVSAVVISLFAIWKSYEFIGEFLFTSNDHFIVRDVIAEQTLLWKDKEDDLSVLIGIEKGKTNIFDINLAEARKRLDLQSDIASVSISRELPDTIRVAIEDRTPRAVVVYDVLLSKGKTKDWLPLDINGIVMSKDSASGRQKGLPRIVGCSVKEKIVEGKELNIVKPALKIVKLILFTVEDPETSEPPANKPFHIMSAGRQRQTLLKVDTISLNTKGVIQFVITLRGLALKKPFVVTINNDDKIKKSFKKMRACILDLISKKAVERRIDLTFNGVIPIRKL